MQTILVATARLDFGAPQAPEARRDEILIFQPQDMEFERHVGGRLAEITETYGNDETHGNLGCKPWVPQTAG